MRVCGYMCYSFAHTYTIYMYKNSKVHSNQFRFNSTETSNCMNACVITVMHSFIRTIYAFCIHDLLFSFLNQ